MRLRGPLLVFTQAAALSGVLGSCSARSSSPQELRTDSSAGAPSGGQGFVALPMAGASAIGNVEPPSDPNIDGDQDGFTPAQGDCSDRDPLVNPAAYDIPGTGIDEDCSGTADDELTNCDQRLPEGGDDALDAARSLGLCKLQRGSGWGVIAAHWVFPDGSVAPDSALVPQFCPMLGMAPNPDSRGLLSTFGPNVKPIQGSSMVAMSSGVARPGIPASMPGLGATPIALMCTQGFAPPGFPKSSPNCGDVQAADDRSIFDAIALELEIKVPSNAKSFSFDFDFYTSEWPAFVCKKYNDFFVALLDSKSPNVPPDRNISFDAKGSPVSVNNAFVEVCDPAIGATRPGGRDFPCSLGTSELVGTSFDPLPNTPTSHAATGWLRTSSAILPGETIRLRFAIWDSGDAIWDSTVLLDHFTWELNAANGPISQGPVTERVPVVK